MKSIRSLREVWVLFRYFPQCKGQEQPSGLLGSMPRIPQVPRVYSFFLTWQLARLVGFDSGVIFEIYMYAQNIFKSSFLVPKPKPENFAKIWSSEGEI